MATHQPQTVTPEQLERAQGFWKAFMKASMIGTVAVAGILVLMALFLL
jgi:hypothetical protein